MKVRSWIIEKGWDRYARWYDTLQPRLSRLFNFFGNLSFEEFQQRFVELADLREGDRVLDIACGTGAAHAAILEIIGPKGKLVGVDLSTEMLRQARSKARRLRFKGVAYRKANVEELSSEFEEGAFDAVISINGLPQFLHPDKALAEMVHVLRPGGRFAVSTINRDRCERNPLLWPLMKLAPQLWSNKRLRRALRELGLVKMRFAEQGLMIIVTAEKRAKRGPGGKGSR